MSASNSIRVSSTGYDSLTDAEADYESVKRVFEQTGEVSSFDAAVLDLGIEGKPRFAESQEPSSSSSRSVPGWASRIAHYLFQGLALVGGEAGNAPLDIPPRAEAAPGLDADELERLAEPLDRAVAGLIVACPTGMADRVGEIVRARDSYVSSAVDVDVPRLDAQIADAVDDSASKPET